MYWDDNSSSINVTGIGFDDHGILDKEERSALVGTFNGTVLGGVDELVEVSGGWELPWNQAAIERSSLGVGQTILLLTV